MTTLISFLGGGKGRASYNETSYKLPDGEIKKTKYVGLALQGFIKPDRLILVGTSGSMWNVFLENQDLLEEELLDDLTQLETAVESSSVDEELLEKFGPAISKKLGTDIQCQLISKATTKEDQVSILQTLADSIPEGEKLLLDVTHGFRHLPMLAMVAARYLSHVKNIQVQNIYYGAWEMRENDIAPVLELKSMLDMLDWVEALAVYDNSGDYGVFAPLLEADGMPSAKANVLKQASFFERTSSPIKASEKLSTAFDSIQSHTGPLGRLFTDALAKRVDWFRKTKRSQKELALAKAYLKHNDYLRCATYLYEAEASRLSGESKVFETRKENYKSNETSDHKFLRILRNDVAHGSRGNSGEVTSTLGDEQKLRTRLSQLFNQLKPGN